MLTEIDRDAYDTLADDVKALVSRVWTAKLAEAQLDAYWEGYDDGKEQGVRNERERLAAGLCEKCGSDVSACFGCMTNVMVGALPKPPAESDK